MKRLFIMRGCPGSGKSSKIKELGLEDYSISLDQIRLLTNGLEYQENNNFGISQEYNGKVYKIFRQMLEMRMQKGAFTIYDATNVKIDNIRNLKKLVKKYEYRVYLVNFDNISLEELLDRNKSRGYKSVPNYVIENMYSDMIKDNDKIPSWLTVIKPEEMDQMVNFYTRDLSHYKKIHHIGDIHGCYEPLEKYFSNNDWFKEDEFYIFHGDMLDRGIQNDKVLSFLLRNYKNDNVIMLTGNHDLHLYNYANNNKYNKNSFENTRKQIEDKFTQKEIRVLMRKFVSAFKYKYNEKEVLCTHGGLPSIPNNINLINEKDLIKGVGDYETNIDKIFTENNLENNKYQVHGHRNILEIDIDEYPKSFNLEGQVEFGRYLRVLTLTKNGFETHYIKNDTFLVPKHEEMIESVDKMYEILSEDRDIKVKEFDNIHSLNFNEKVFRNKSWNRRNTKARGLFINVENKSIACRGYDKFFNYGEGIYNTDPEIKRLNYPLTLYLKENGFLGLLGYDETNDKLVFASKSSITGDYAKNFERIAKNTFGDKLEKLKEDLKKTNTSLVFEVIDPVADPHLIKYEKEQIILLDKIYREPVFNKYNYEDLEKFAKEYDLQYKQKTHIIESFEEFKEFVEIANQYEYKYNNKHIEGFIVEDKDGYMFKLKLTYYNFWKHCRVLINNFEKYKLLYENNSYLKDGDKHNISFLNETFYRDLSKEFLEFLINNESLIKKKNIIELREIFLNERQA